MPGTRVIRWVCSLAARIPRAVAEEARIQGGDSIVIGALAGSIELRRAARVPTLEESVARITPENCHGETAWGRDVGKEIVEW
jgi:antitoxin MazE